MNRDETNGYLRAAESQLWEIHNRLVELDARGEFSDEAWKAFREIRVNLTNVSCDFANVRGWNSINNSNEKE